MKRICFVLQTSLDDAAAAACGYVPDPATPNLHPAALSQVDRYTMLEADYGNGVNLVAKSFRFSSVPRDSTTSEADLIEMLQVDLFALEAEPGTTCYHFTSAGEILFYRALRHQVYLHSLSGTVTPFGRVFGRTLDPICASGLPPSHWTMVCAGLGIPLAEAIAGLDPADPYYWANRAQIEATAGWLNGMMFEHADNPPETQANWQKLALTIKAQPVWSHLQPFADAARNRQKPSSRAEIDAILGINQA